MTPARLLPALAVSVLVGCAGRGGGAKSSAPEKPPEDPWPRVARDLRSENDPATARRVLTELNAGLAANPAADPVPGLAPDAEAALRAVVPLSADDATELANAGFTPLDAAYLADAYYLRDAARALEAPADPAARAAAAFAWVGRQVVLQPWATPAGQGQLVLNPPVPPTFALRRGSGSGLDRAFVFLAVLQQLGLDACLVGPAAADGKPWSWTPAGGSTGKGPFWAVGVRAGADVVLFDPWRGEPVPGTLAEVTANPDRLKAWFDDKTRPWDVTPETVKVSVPFVAVPLSALAPRTKLLERKLDRDPDPTVIGEPRLAVDTVALRGRFGPAAKVWNPPADPFTYSRGLASFLPLDEGGRDATPPGPRRLFDQYKLSLVPGQLLGGIGGVHPDALTQFRLFVLGSYEKSFLVPPTPRERVQRGMFSDATPDLVTKRDAFLAATERIRTDKDRDALLRDWVGKANEAYENLSIARLKEKTDPAGVAVAQQAVADFWKKESKGAEALRDQVIAAVGAAEATYLLAACKHEQAERAQVRFDRAVAAAGSDPRGAAAADRARDAARDAWTDARDWWGRYDPYLAAQNAAFPGRGDHARKLADRATRAAAALGGR